MVFTEFYLVLLSLTGFYWVLPGFTGFPWFVLGFTGILFLSGNFLFVFYVVVVVFLIYKENPFFFDRFPFLFLDSPGIASIVVEHWQVWAGGVAGGGVVNRFPGPFFLSFLTSF